MRRWKYETASDLTLPPGERLQSIRREKGMASSISHGLFMAGMWTYFRLYHRHTVIGREKLPTKTPFIICSNHTSHADSMALACALPPAVRLETYMVAAGDVFFSNRAMSAISATLINALPLWRKKVTTHALEELRDRLVKGHGGLIVFPEGQRSRDGRPGRFKPGIGMIVAGTDIPVYPCHITGSFEALPPGKNVPRPRKITVRVGDPLRFEEFANDRHGWEEVAGKIRAAIGALAPEAWVAAPVTAPGAPGSTPDEAHDAN